MKRTLIIITICFLIGSLTGCGDEGTIAPPDAEELVGEGWQEYGDGFYEDAIAKFQDALEEDSASSEAHNGIGWSEARLGRVSESIESFKKAAAKDPGNADAHVGLAGAYMADSDYERAIASANLAISLAPEYISHHDNIKTADIRILLAECYYGKGEYDKAKLQIDLLGNAGASLDPSSSTYLADLLFVIEGLTKSGHLTNAG